MQPFNENFRENGWFSSCNVGKTFEKMYAQLHYTTKIFYRQKVL